jgi:glycosyltransferase involved in cell wall biosynthesis
MELFACGTPVIAFKIGGLPDMVRPGETGWLVPPFDTTALSATIADAICNKPELVRLGLHCREVAENEYSLCK